MLSATTRRCWDTLSIAASRLRADKRLECSVSLFTPKSTNEYSEEKRHTGSDVAQDKKVRDDHCAQRLGHELNGRQRVRMGQWNVRGLNSLGKLSILSSELEKPDISTSQHWMDTQCCSQAKPRTSIMELPSGFTRGLLAA